MCPVYFAPWVSTLFWELHGTKIFRPPSTLVLNHLIFRKQRGQFRKSFYQQYTGYLWTKQELASWIIRKNRLKKSSTKDLLTLQNQPSSTVTRVAVVKCMKVERYRTSATIFKIDYQRTSTLTLDEDGVIEIRAFIFILILFQIHSMGDRFGLWGGQFKISKVCSERNSISTRF